MTYRPLQRSPNRFPFIGKVGSQREIDGVRLSVKITRITRHQHHSACFHPTVSPDVIFRFFFFTGMNSDQFRSTRIRPFGLYCHDLHVERIYQPHTSWFIVLVLLSYGDGFDMSFNLRLSILQALIRTFTLSGRKWKSDKWGIFSKTICLQERL